MSKISKLIIFNISAFVILTILLFLHLISSDTFQTATFIIPFLSLFISYSRKIIILFWEACIVFGLSTSYYIGNMALESKLEQTVFFLIIVAVSINSIVALIRKYISESKNNNFSSFEKAIYIIAFIFFVTIPLFAGIYSDYNNMSSKDMKSEYEHRLESDTGIDSDDFD